MNHCVPDFHTEDDYHFPSPSSGTFRSRKPPSMQEDEVMELLWQNGQVVMQRPIKQSPPALNAAGSSSSSGLPAAAAAPQLFIQEDEMASWLHYPLDDEPQFDRDFCSDLLFPASSCTDTAVIHPTHQDRPQTIPHSSKPPIPPSSRVDDDCTAHGFGHFSRFRPRQDSVSAAPHKAAKDSVSETVVESNVTPVAAPPESMASQPAKDSGKTGFIAGSSSVGGGMETTSLDFTVESSSGASGAEPGLKPSASDDKKRKDPEADETEFHSQDFILKDADAKKQVRGSTGKRTRAAEVHNLSERRRRDRINEKMKALQELIPRCNKSDKASMLDDAIEYLKSLQMQVQMMSMGCGMVPMMFSGMQQYMQPIGMGMGMGVDVNCPMMPFPMPGPRFPVPSYPIQPFVAPDSSRIQVNNPTSMVNLTGTQNAYQLQVQTIPDQYQQYLGCQTMQMQPPQNEVMSNQMPASEAPVVDQKTRVED